jgi:hypothetical protein
MKKYNFTGSEAIFDHKQPGFISPYRRSVYLVLVAIMLGISCMEAQVTIGGDKAPAAGSLLSLNSDTRGGLQLSNVSLDDPTEIPTDENDPSLFPGIYGLEEQDLAVAKGEFKGSMVYNTNPLVGRGKGIYVWSGENWDYVGNLRHLEVPGYGNDGDKGTDVITGTGIGTWLADKSGFVICTWRTEASGNTNDAGVWIGNGTDNVKVIGSDYTNTGSVQKAMVPIAAGQVLTVKSHAGSAVGATFYLPLFSKELAVDGYSFNEIRTDDIWVDKPIYKKTVYSQDTYVSKNNNAGYSLVRDVFADPNNIDKVLKIEGYGYVLDNGSNNQIGFIGSWYYVGHYCTLSLYYNRTYTSPGRYANSIMLEVNNQNVAGSAITINDFTITIYYTKVND